MLGVVGTEHTQILVAGWVTDPTSSLEKLFRPQVPIHTWGWWDWEVSGTAASCSLPEAPGKLSPLKVDQHKASH